MIVDIAFLDALQDFPDIAILDMSSTWPVLRQLRLEKNLSANAIPYALIAATGMQNNEVLATLDRDFSVCCHCNNSSCW